MTSMRLILQVIFLNIKLYNQIMNRIEKRTIFSLILVLWNHIIKSYIVLFFNRLLLPLGG